MAAILNINHRLHRFALINTDFIISYKKVLVIHGSEYLNMQIPYELCLKSIIPEYIP